MCSFSLRPLSQFVSRIVGRNLLVFGCIALSLVSTLVILFVEEASAESPKKAESSEKEGSQRPRVTAGLYFGHLYNIQVDGTAVTVKPIDHTLPRKRFYLDRKTYYKNKKRKGSFKNLELGQKVAIRYVQRDDIALADAVFIVEGEFNRSDYLPKRLAPKKAEGENKGEGEKGGEEKKAEGGHEKPAEKKGGGH